jgi:type I restriction enzyme, S subunit
VTWRSVRCKQLFDVADVRCGTENLPLLAVSIHRGVVPRTDFTDKEPRADDLSAYKVVRRGQIAVNRMRAFQGAIGIAQQDGIVSPDYLVLTPTGADARYLHHLLRSDLFVGQMAARLRGIGSVDQGNVRTPRINSEDLRDLLVRVPPIPEQVRIANFLDAETARIDAIRNARTRQVVLLQSRWRVKVRMEMATLASTHGCIRSKG